MTPPDEEKNIDVLSALLQSKGLDASDFIDVINALSNIKKREQDKIEKETIIEHLRSDIFTSK